MRLNRFFTILSIVTFIFVFSYFVYGNETKENEEQIDKKLHELYMKYGITPPGTKKNETIKHDFIYLKQDLNRFKKRISKIEGKYSLVILKDEFIMLLFKGHTFIKAYIIGVGMNKDGGDKLKVNDNRTPEGKFWITKKQRSDYWQFEGKYAYGPWFLRLKTPWKGIGIHGTDSLEVLGTKCTHGCIRTDNGSIIELKKLLPIKAKVDIYRNQYDVEPGTYYLPNIEELIDRISRPQE
ncbi:L,D-transpeptidase [bacterium]|nr:L,D-transpeptidase [bacterium]